VTADVAVRSENPALRSIILFEVDCVSTRQQRQSSNEKSAVKGARRVTRLCPTAAASCCLFPIFPRRRRRWKSTRVDREDSEDSAAWRGRKRSHARALWLCSPRANERGNSQSVTRGTTRAWVWWSNLEEARYATNGPATCEIRVPRLNRASIRETNETSTKPRSRSRILISPRRSIRLRTRFCKIPSRVQLSRRWTRRFRCHYDELVDSLFVSLFIIHCPLLVLLIVARVQQYANRRVLFCRFCRFSRERETWNEIDREREINQL